MHSCTRIIGPLQNGAPSPRKAEGRGIGALSTLVVPRPEYPRPTFRRRDWVNLNGEWEFGVGEKRRFDRRIQVPFAPQSRHSGIDDWKSSDVVWYRRHFDAAQSDRLLLHFGAVDYRAVVWVNGVEVVRHEGGHTPFSADVGHVVH